jgi:adenine-specific DNA-methyltransferase
MYNNKQIEYGANENEGIMSDDTNIEKIDLDKVDWRGSREFFESLGEALDKLDDKDESYDFTWVGKRKSIIEAGAPISKTFRPDLENSKNWDTTENLFIEGDNLDALKLLQESYLGKVKMIYIDPPYNTGKDFVYHDNFKATTVDYDDNTEYKDDKGNIQFKKNEKTNGRYHSDWLSMMYPRLKLARNLLGVDGVIFISIDDNEQANLKKMCDEVFGEDNFIADFIWTKKEKASGVPPVNMILPNKEHVLCYKKADEVKFTGQERSLKSYKQNEDGRWWRLMPIQATGNQNSYFNITDPATNNVYHGNWAFSEETIKRMVGDGKIAFPKSGKGLPTQIVFADEMKNDTSPIFEYLGLYESEVSSKALIKLMDGKYFDFPKPVDLIKFFINQCTTSNDLILDFFSGSGTTAHAVMQLNAEDGCSRKWIMVQLPEKIDEASDAFKAGYKTIPEISRERIRRAGAKIENEFPEEKIDYGFRSLVITDSNNKDVYKPANETTQQSLIDTVDNIKEDRTEIDLLYGILTATALELNRPFEKRDIAGSDVFLYDYFSEVSGLVACFSESVSEDTIKEIAKLKPLTAVFRDSSFPDSQAKVNLSEHFRIISPDTKVKVI